MSSALENNKKGTINMNKILKKTIILTIMEIIFFVSAADIDLVINSFRFDEED